MTVKAEPKVCSCICSLDTVLLEWALRSFEPLSTVDQPDFDKAVMIDRGTISIGQKRDVLIRLALQSPLVFTHLFFLDTDVLVENMDINEALRRMIAADVDIVSAAVRCKKKGWENMFWIYNKDTQRNEPVEKWNETIKLLEVDAVGAGFLLIKRDVLKGLGPPWFQVTTLGARTEDSEFCERAKAKGYKIYVYTPVKCSHAGTFKLTSKGQVTTVEDSTIYEKLEPWTEIWNETYPDDAV
jgi:hypothetical protein